jgi:transglutaminase-like putative cysteine protease
MKKVRYSEHNGCQNPVRGRGNIRPRSLAILLAICYLIIASFASEGIVAMNSTSDTLHQELPPYLVEHRLPTRLQELERRGMLQKVEQELSALAAGHTPAEVSDELSPPLAEWERERLRRLRREFSLSPEEFLQKLRAQIPDASLEDVYGWAASGELQTLAFDGQLWIFRREPANLFRFCEAAQRRRRLPMAKAPATSQSLGDPSEKTTQYFVLNHHLREIVAQCAATSAPRVHEVRVRATHTVHLHPGKVPAGHIVRCWLPFPRADHEQHSVRLIAADPEPRLIAPAEAPQRTVYFERPAGVDGATSFSLTFEYVTSAQLPLLAKAKAERPLSSEEREQYLREEPPHIAFSSEVQRLSQEIVGAHGAEPELERARMIFDWVVTHMRYASEMEYGVLPRIVEKALATRRGDCGVQALLFITLCRAAGIPARWVSGWVVYPSGWNMHDWAEFYVQPYGWLPADPSRGWRDDADPRVRSFYFGNTDAYRMVANVAACAAFQPPKRFWRSDPVDNQRGELEWDGGNLYYDDWSYDVQVSTERLD